MPFAQQRAQALAVRSCLRDRSWERRRPRRRADPRHPAPVRARAFPRSRRRVRSSPATQHRALARDVAARSMVLLRNEPVDEPPALPLTGRRWPARGARPAGRPANTGDHGSSDVRAPEVVTPLAGLRAALPAGHARIGDDPRPPSAAGRGRRGGGRRLHRRGRRRVRRVVRPRAGHPVPAVERPGALDELARAWEAGPQSVGRRPRLAPAARRGRGADPAWSARRTPHDRRRRGRSRGHHGEPGGTTCRRSCMAWYSGMEGGSALADVLLGDGEPGGRLPFAVPLQRGRPAAVRQERHRGDLRPVARPAAARPGPARRRLPARIRPVVYVLHHSDDVGSAVDGDAAHASGRPWRTPATGPAATSFRSTRAGPAERADIERFLVGFARVECAPGERVPVKLDVPLQRLSTRLGPGRWAVRPAATGSTWARAPRIRLRCP